MSRLADPRNRAIDRVLARSPSSPLPMNRFERICIVSWRSHARRVSFVNTIRDFSSAGNTLKIA